MCKEIQQYFYKITLAAPVGTRYGHLQMEVKQGLISGCVDILNHKSPLTGQVLDNGTCRLTGTLTSLMQTFFCATNQPAPWIIRPASRYSRFFRICAGKRGQRL